MYLKIIPGSISADVFLKGTEMTTCELILKPITRMVEDEKKSLDEIADSVCPKVEYGREKVIRIIKDFLGEEYLIQHAETLKYDVEMAKLAKKKKSKPESHPESHEKISATTDNDLDSLIKKINRLLKDYSIEEICDALDIIKNKTQI